MIRLLEIPKPCPWEKHLAGMGIRTTLSEIRGSSDSIKLVGTCGTAAHRTTVFKSHLRASHVTPAFRWKRPNFSTELFFFFHGTDGKIFILNNFMEEIVISPALLACVRFHMLA